jgi:uracil-DNA glycosylase
MYITTSFDINCTQCSRLVSFLGEVKDKHPTYFCKPVASFGADDAKLLIVGLAPGLHGANKTGRPFTGDDSGNLLYDTLYKYGFANKPESIAADNGLQLINCRITNAVKCLPPDNKPLPSEVTSCNRFLSAETHTLVEGDVVLALGTVAHAAILKTFGLKLKDYKFSHGAWYTLPNGLKMVDSYHCSRYNTQTKRLTEAMFHQVFSDVQSILTKES